MRSPNFTNLAQTVAIQPGPYKSVGPRVYFVSTDDGGRIKIGRATTLRTRLSALRTDSPVNLTLSATMPGGHELEQNTHAFVREERDRGEWFRGTVLLQLLMSAARRSPEETTIAISSHHQGERSVRFRALAYLFGMESEITEDVLVHAMECKECRGHIRKCRGVAPQVGTAKPAHAKGGRR